MNAAIKQQWIDALRSGDYQQATGSLRTEEGFCCLGVLCDLHRKAINKKKARWEKITHFGTFTYIGDADILPQDVIDWAGLKNADPICGVGSLSGHNDNGKSFCEIAEIISESL